MVGTDENCLFSCDDCEIKNLNESTEVLVQVKAELFG